jgi:predicted lipoprotein with Yx(FWY)xxD motif
MKRTMLVSATIAAAIALLAAGCGGGNKSSGSSGGSPATTNSPATTAATGATIAVKSSKLGKILVDDQGRTLYLFEKDKSPTSTCSGACAAAWPPDTTNGTPMASSGAIAADLNTSARADGSTQLVYHGHPLYRYSGDVKAGDTNGEGLDQFGAEWYVLSPTGNKIEKGES